MELQGIRVALVNWRDPGHSLAGGSERYAWELARGLAEAGAEVEFLTARDEGQARGDRLDGISVVRRGGRFSFYGWVLLRLALQRLRRRAPAVVVDAENGIPAFTPLVLGRDSRVVLVMHHVHQQQFRTYFSRPMSDVGRFLEGPAMRRLYRGRTTLVVSPSTDVEMRHQLGWTGETLLVPNGNVLATLDGPALAAAKSGPVRRVLVLGRLAMHKRIDLVLEAVARLRDDHPGLVVDVVGGGPIEEELRSRVDELGLAGAVTVHGYLPEEAKVDLLTRAHLNVCGSDAEGWGQVVVEAAAYAVPTVARDVPGLRDSIRDGRTGWLVGVGETDTAAVVDSLEKGIRGALADLADPGRAARFREECLAWAAGFSWHRMRSHAVAVVATELGLPTRHPVPERLGPQASSSTR